ncbi:MAG: hypothetical protein ACI8RZ_002962 [Myxococcota bacterium]|jgi:hypothetical protein
MTGVLLSLTASAAPAILTDAGDARPKRPVALIVCTPGLSEFAYDPLVAALESAGLDAWTLSFPPTAQDASAIIGQWLPEVTASLSVDRPIAVVGHGLGGTLAALSVESGALTPSALAMLGSPLRTESTGLHDWLLAQPLPEDDLDLAPLAETQWQDMGALALLIGEPLPPFEDVSVDWLVQLQAWASGGLSVDLRDTDVPIWAGASGLDNLGPPEWIRPGVPPESFFRFGYLRFDSEDPDHIGLLSSPRALKMLSRWVKLTLESP